MFNINLDMLRWAKVFCGISINQERMVYKSKIQAVEAKAKR